MVAFGRHSLDWLSHQWPGKPYPYPKTTIFQGYADMEYPMMVNDATQEELNFARFVAEHEIAHTWFPFYMGIMKPGMRLWMKDGPPPLNC